MRNLKIREKIKDLLFKNLKIRRFRGFFNNVIFPYFAKIALSLLFLLFLSFFALKFLRPDLLSTIYKRGSHYLIHYFDLDSRAFLSIEVTGVKRSDEKRIIRLAKEVKSNKNIGGSFLIKKIAQKIRDDQDWVSNVRILRTLPNHLNIVVEEYIPFAIWQESGEEYVIDRQGNRVKIDNSSDFEYLIILSGKGAYLHATSLFNILATNPELSSHVYSATWVGDRRWDLRFENGLLVKLPASNLERRWRDLDKIYNTKGALRDLKVIDLRLSRKTYLEYKSKK